MSGHDLVLELVGSHVNSRESEMVVIYSICDCERVV